jgi:hypothetical protein
MLLQQMANASAEPSFKIAPNETTSWGDGVLRITATTDLHCSDTAVISAVILMGLYSHRRSALECNSIRTDDVHPQG